MVPSPKYVESSTNARELIGCVGVVANAICLTFVDKVGRKKPLAYTSIALCFDMALLMVFSKYYSNSTNKVGTGKLFAFS